MLRKSFGLVNGSARCGVKALAERLEDRRLLSAVSGAVAPLVQSATQTLNASTPDSDNQTPTAWLWYNGVDPNTLGTAINQGYRLVDLSVAQGSPLRFNAALVQNTGTYAKTWWWYYGATGNDITNALTTNSARLTDLDPYVDGSGQERFAAVMVSNTGSEAKGWWWYYNATSQFIDNAVNTNNARLVDLNRTVVNGTTEYAAVMISNTGADAKAWWYYYDQTPGQINSLLSTNNARLIHIEPVDSGHFDVIMDRTAGERWYWYYGVSGNELADLVSQDGARIFDIESYQSGTQTLYTAALIDNSNPLEDTVGDILRGASSTAATGLYLKQVGGPVLAQLQPDKQFEPASMIKVVLNLGAMRKVAAGTAHLSDPMYMYYNPTNPYINFNSPGNPDENPDSYADTTSNRVQLTLGQLLEMMMERSDNRATKAIEQFLGIPLINSTAQSVGMTNTVFASTLGSGIPGNFLTLDDAGKLYEGVLNGSQLNPAYVPEFWRRMTDENDSDREDVPFQEGIFGPFQTDVTQEAASILALPQSDPLVTQLANAFIAGMKGSWKGGGYTLGKPNNQYDEVRTVGGYLGVPVEDSAGNTTIQDYVYGVFIDGALVPQYPPNNPNPQVQAVNDAWSNSQQELLRGVIHDALASWHVNPNLVVTNLNDSGAGSLRRAIQIANSSVGTATITFSPGLAGTITLTGGQLGLDNPYCRFVIRGPGAAKLTVSGNNQSRVFSITYGTSAEIDDLSVINGNSSGGAGGGIDDLGSLNLWRSSVAGNTAGIGGGGGIAVGSAGVLNLYNSTVSGNSATDGAGINDLGTLAATNSTVVGNIATGQGGGVWIGNLGSTNGTLVNLTISGNHAALGGGIYRGTGTVTLKNTIVAQNLRGATTTADDISGTVATTSAFNLIGTGGGGGLINGTNGNQVGVVNSGLAPLANYGGPTLTIALMAGSPAFNHGSNSLILNGITTDQRGLPRIYGGTVDIGAYESQPSALAGDVNHDGVVNFSDLLILAQHYGQTSVPMYETGDMNGDGTVGFGDLLTLAQNYGHSLGPATVSAAKTRARKH